MGMMSLHRLAREGILAMQGEQAALKTDEGSQPLINLMERFLPSVRSKKRLVGGTRPPATCLLACMLACLLACLIIRFVSCSLTCLSM